nr:MAG TPA: hypothetical protein [Caudoviricetes sp.]
MELGIHSIFFFSPVLAAKIMTLIYWLYYIVNNLFDTRLMMGGLLARSCKLRCSRLIV